MNSKQAIKRMKEINNQIDNAEAIELKLIAYNDFTTSGHNRKIIYKKRISKLKKEAKEIYNMFDDGCSRDFFDLDWGKKKLYTCGDSANRFLELKDFCPYCREIKEIWFALHAVSEPGVKDE